MGNRVTTGRTVFVEEFGPEAWTLSGGPTGYACSIVGMQSCIWNNLNQNFLSSLLPYLSVQGVTDASLYPANIVAACAPTYPDNPNDDNGVLNTVTNAIEQHQYSLTGTGLSTILAQWNKSSVNGATLSGVSLTH